LAPREGAAGAVCAPAAASAARLAANTIVIARMNMRFPLDIGHQRRAAVGAVAGHCLSAGLSDPPAFIGPLFGADRRHVNRFGMTLG